MPSNLCTPLIVASVNKVTKTVSEKKLLRNNSAARQLQERSSSSFSLMFVQCRFTSTETVRTVRDGEPRTSTSTFTQLLTSMGYDILSMLLCVHRDYNYYAL